MRAQAEVNDLHNYTSEDVQYGISKVQRTIEDLRALINQIPLLEKYEEKHGRKNTGI